MVTQLNRQPEQKLISRRTLLKGAALGLGAGLGGRSLAHMLNVPIEDQIAYAAEGVNRASAPSDLRITDLRVAVVRLSQRQPIIRIDTNQGISGYGEVRDNASERYALMLKSRIIVPGGGRGGRGGGGGMGGGGARGAFAAMGLPGENPCNVEKIFKKLKQFGGQARQGGGVSAIEMACWDLAGKAYGVPVYQLLGGKYRDRIRLYCDTTANNAASMRARQQMGFTWLKMDLPVPTGDLTYPAGADTQNTKHPFTGIQISDRGAAEAAQTLARVREAVGYQIPIGLDHFGSIGVKGCIKLAKALSPYQPAYLEDMIPWEYTDLIKEIRDATDVPLLTGEDIYLLENFKPLIDSHAVDYVQPDLATAGGILETKKIGDYAEEHGVAMILHNASAPICFMANVHCAAATQNFIALEHHAVDVSYWESLVKTADGGSIWDTRNPNSLGYARLLEAPGLGVEPNEEIIRQHLQGSGYFEPTLEWDRDTSNDKLWS